MPKVGLNRAVKSGMVWLAVERGGLQVLNLVTSAILARLLGPAAFGIMGMSAFFTGISRRLVNLGFGAAVIRRKEIRPDHISTLFVLTMLINTSICLGLVALSPLAGRYFDNPLVGEVLRWMSLVFVLRAIGTVPSAILRRRLDFESNAYASFIDAMGKLLVSVPLAWYGYGVWALVYGELAGSLADKLFLAWRARWVPSLRVTRAAIDDLFVFGMTMSVRGLVGYTAENIDNLVVGKTLGMAALGFYEKSYNLMRMPVSELSSRLGVVLFPALAKIQEERGRFRAAFRKALLGMSIVGFPLFATFIVLGGPIILVLYGPKWAPAVLPFQILCGSGPLRMASGLCSSAIDACGNLRQDLWRRVLGLGILVMLVLVGVRWGLEGVALGVLTTNVISFTLLVTLLHRVTPLHLSDVLESQALPAAATVLLVGAELAFLFTGHRRGWPELVTLLVAVPAGFSAYALGLYLFRTTSLTALWQELSGDVKGVLPWASEARRKA
jgi:PST family polysaccharide transporter